MNVLDLGHLCLCVLLPRFATGHRRAEQNSKSMRTSILLTVSLVALSSAAATVAAEFVGVTSSQVRPGEPFGPLGGIAAAHARCQADFQNTRLCTTRDIFSSQLPSGGIRSEAWVYPHFVGGGAAPASAIDFIGFIDSPNALTCEAWLNTPGLALGGLKVRPDGALARESDCNRSLPLACCKLTQTNP